MKSNGWFYGIIVFLAQTCNPNYQSGYEFQPYFPEESITFEDFDIDEDIEIEEPRTILPEPPPPPPPMEKKEKKYDEIFKVVEDMPRFPSCENKGLGKREIKECAQDSMLNFIYKNIKYPEEARKNNIEGRVYIQFVVEKDGSLANIKVLKDPSTGVLGEEAKRVIQLMNDRNIKWIPGKQRGKPVKVSYTLPIKFSL